MEPKEKTIKLSFCQNSDFLISISLQPNVVVVAGCKEIGIRKSMFVAKTLSVVLAFIITKIDYKRY